MGGEQWNISEGGSVTPFRLSPHDSTQLPAPHLRRTGSSFCPDPVLVFVHVPVPVLIFTLGGIILAIDLVIAIVRVLVFGVHLVK